MLKAILGLRPLRLDIVKFKVILEYQLTGVYNRASINFFVHEVWKDPWVSSTFWLRLSAVKPTRIYYLLLFSFKINEIDYFMLDLPTTTGDR